MPKNSIAPNLQEKKEKISRNTEHLMAQRRELREKHTKNSTEFRKLNKDIFKAIRKNMRNYNTEEVSKVIEENKSLKVLRKKLTVGSKNIFKLANNEGQIRTNREEILQILEEFYSNLYKRESGENNKLSISKVLNQGSEEIPEISINKIGKAMSEMKNNKSPGEDEIVVEAIRAGGDPIVKAIYKLVNACLESEITLSDWNNAVIIIMHKKGDITSLGNYRPISLLSLSLICINFSRRLFQNG